MQNRLMLCATYLKEVEEKLLALQDSMEVAPEQRGNIAEALSFVQQARKAVSQTKASVDSLYTPSAGTG